MNNISQGVRVRACLHDGGIAHLVGRVLNSEDRANPSIFDNRGDGLEGVALNTIPGHGAEFWFVRQENGIAAYHSLELEPIIDHTRKWTMDEAIEREA